MKAVGGLGLNRKRRRPVRGQKRVWEGSIWEENAGMKQKAALRRVWTGCPEEITLRLEGLEEG